MNSVKDFYGSLVFDDKVMSRRLPKETYEALQNTIRMGKDIDLSIANIVANAMKDWAIENGATHYTHWFQPMTGLTAEKHDSFISPQEDGSVLMEFSGKELIKGEPDASSFPSGGLRATFEARGYTAWDPTSFAFIKEKTLCIPTAFCSYSGAVLDKKTPLLRSMEVLNTQALRILRLFGDTETKSVKPSVGLEQEYFLIDKELFNKRRDLKYCGRTLIGRPSCKGQELEDHYFGAIKPRVSAFMEELNRTLWEFGIPAKTEHNETAPAQHEIASIYSTANLSIDRNLLIMEEMKKIADKMGLSCLLHEKPFEGINGSGKHNNWSLSTDSGVNLFEIGDTWKQNYQFLLFMVAVVTAIDRYPELLAATAASPSNDCRLGGSEAPPSIISIYLGDELTSLFDTNAKKKGKEKIGFGVHVLPVLPKDGADRNRTSPVAFTGNKFEFRMLGSQINASEPNVVINTAVAEALSEFVDRLEKAENFDSELVKLIKEYYEAHKRIIFNGNNYTEQWYEEAARRGLKAYSSTAEASLALVEEKTIDLFEKFGILSKEEIESRAEIVQEQYSKTINIESGVLIEMLQTEVVPASCRYMKDLADGVSAKKAISVSIDCMNEIKLIDQIQKEVNSILVNLPVLRHAIEESKQIPKASNNALYYAKTVLPLMKTLRKAADTLEGLVARDYWNIPSIEDMLFSV